jgi:hypothetical protein
VVLAHSQQPLVRAQVQRANSALRISMQQQQAGPLSALTARPTPPLQWAHGVFPTVNAMPATPAMMVPRVHCVRRESSKRSTLAIHMTMTTSVWIALIIPTLLPAPTTTTPTLLPAPCREVAHATQAIHRKVREYPSNAPTSLPRPRPPGPLSSQVAETLRDL